MPKAKLVTIGDSLTQGFHSAAITNTAQSYPALIARSLGLGPAEFRQPNFLGCGGLPCSIEWLARRLEERFGADLSAFEWLRAVYAVSELLDEVEDYWERGKGSQPGADARFHNLAVWGFEVSDSYLINAGLCREHTQRSSDGLLAIPSEARLRTALRVLNPAFTDTGWSRTQLSVAEEIREKQGGIEHLIVWLGANNCLGTVVDLQIRETPAAPPGPLSGYTLWHTQAFATEYAELAARIKALGAEHVYVATIPHVTIPPITRGIMKHRGRLPDDRKYYDYYARFFVADREFDASSDPHLTGEQAEYVDRRIDEYNATIADHARENGWELVDVCGVLDGLAVRRNHGRVTYPLPPALSDLSVRFFETEPGGRLRCGGLIGLDGVHPTPTGYAIVAHEFVKALRRHEPAVKPVNFAQVRELDALVSRPPRTLDDMFGALRTLEAHFHFSRWLSSARASS